jgi:hypothetical protein
MASSPRISTGHTGTAPDAEAMQKAPIAVHHRSACSGVKALRNTTDARRQAAKLCYRFGPLTPSARSANLIAGDGTKNGLPAPNKEPASKPKQPLDRKSPIQVRIHFPPSESLQTPGPSRDGWSLAASITAKNRTGTDADNFKLLGYAQRFDVGRTNR